MKEVFGFELNEHIETFTLFNSYCTDTRNWTGDTWYGTADGENKYTLLDTKLSKTLQYMTRADFNGVLNYSSVYIHNTVVHFVDNVATMNSASARISTQNSGLRFKTVYSDAYLDKMKAYAAEKGVEMKVGTLIAPNDYVERSGAFTHKALGAGNYVQVFGDVEKAYAKGSGTTTIAGSIVNIKEKNLNRDFAGIGFIQIGDEYFYASTYAVRNIAFVANAALNDTWNTEIPGYKNKVAEGAYSPYTADQRTILGELIAK